jgi:hypothetical protein
MYRQIPVWRQAGRFLLMPRIRELKDNGCPLPVLQKITGHRSLRTLTEHYPGPRQCGRGTTTQTQLPGADAKAELPPTVFPALQGGRQPSLRTWPAR